MSLEVLRPKYTKRSQTKWQNGQVKYRLASKARNNESKIYSGGYLQFAIEFG